MRELRIELNITAPENELVDDNAILIAIRQCIMVHGPAIKVDSIKYVNVKRIKL